MENQAVKVKVHSRVWFQDQIPKGYLSEVKIFLSREVEEFLLETNGSVSSIRTYRSSSPLDPLISLRFKNFRPTYVYERLHSKLKDPLLSCLVSNKIIDQAQGKDLSQQSLCMIIIVQRTDKEYIVVPSVSAPSTTTTDSDQESCAICLENMCQSKSNPICQLPNCVHLFHEDCLTKWFGKQEQSSCPLCRQVVENLTEEKFNYGSLEV